MTYLIVGIGIIVFICWIAWELKHAPMIDEDFMIFNIDDAEDDEQDSKSIEGKENNGD